MSIDLPLIVAAVARKGGALLLVREKRNDHTEWNLPGGRVKEGETLSEALTREVQEETGQTVSHIGAVAYIVESKRKHRPFERRVAIVFEVDVLEADVDVPPHDPVSEARFVDIDVAMQLLRDSIVPTRQPLSAYLRGGGAHGGYWAYWEENGTYMRRSS